MIRTDLPVDPLFQSINDYTVARYWGTKTASQDNDVQTLVSVPSGKTAYLYRLNSLGVDAADAPKLRIGDTDVALGDPLPARGGYAPIDWSTSMPSGSAGEDIKIVIANNGTAVTIDLVYLLVD